MEFDSREAYRRRVARVAGHSDVGEIELARLAVRLAEEAKIERRRLRHCANACVTLAITWWMRPAPKNCCTA